MIKELYFYYDLTKVFINISLYRQTQVDNQDI